MLARLAKIVCAGYLCLLLSFAAGQLPPGATMMPGGSGPEQPPPSEEDRASEGARIVASKEQNPCIDKAETAECLEFAKAGECEENKRWMHANCEKTCRRCIDHLPFWASKEDGGHITHVNSKKSLTKLRKRDEMTVVMWHHKNPGICKGCTYALPFYADAVQAATTEFPDIIFAAVDCAKLEKTCSKMKFRSEDGSLPVFKFFGDAAHWKIDSKGNQGVDLAPGGLMKPEFAGIKQAIEEYEEWMFSADAAGVSDDDDEPVGDAKDEL